MGRAVPVPVTPLFQGFPGPGLRKGEHHHRTGGCQRAGQSCVPVYRRPAGKQAADEDPGSLTGRKGDTYMVNAWGRGTPLPETDNDRYRRFGVEVAFVDDAGNTDTHYTNFSPDILDWQFLSDV